ncbi:CSTOS protein, partial [Caloenas nicobarica]|nr:CSTOS protein [Caloenas nicobarica]
MAAPRAGWGPDSDSDSDSSGEAAARFREAAWDCAAAGRAEPAGELQMLLTVKEIIIIHISNRREVNGHGEDGNELQTTPEFRAHVAKKLGAMLDGFITVLKDPSGPSQTSVQQPDSADDGFRLFSSSVLGDCGESEPCPAVRRRQPSSSSDTDSDQEWQRYQEAAVSATDILKQKNSVLPGAVKKKKKKKK